MMQLILPDRYQSHLLAMLVLHISLHFIWVFLQREDHKSGSDQRMKKRATSSNQDDEIQGTAGQTCNYFASDTPSTILVASLLEPPLLQTAGEWTWDIQSLSLNWQTDRNTCCNNLWKPLHMVLLFSWPDCLVVDGVKASLVARGEQLGKCNIWGFLPVEPIETLVCIQTRNCVRRIQSGIDWWFLKKLDKCKKANFFHGLLFILLFSSSSACHSWEEACACFWPN